MAHNLFNKRYFGRRPAWHALGVVMDNEVTASQAVQLARLDYEVIKAPVQVPVLGSVLEFPGTVGLVRLPTPDDPHPRLFATVSDHYEVVQNREIFGVLDGVSEKWPVETAGALGYGEKAFMTLSAGQTELGKAKDLLDLYFLVLEDKTGGGSLSIFFTPVRVVCQNTLNVGIKEAVIGSAIQHRAGVLDEYKLRALLMAKMVAAKDNVLGVFEQMVAKTITRSEENAVIDAAYPLPKPTRRTKFLQEVAGGDLTEEQRSLVLSLSSAPEKTQYLAEAALEDRMLVRQNLDKFNDEFPAMARTPWAAYQAVTEAEDHLRRITSRAAAASVFGSRAETKKRAFAAALELV